MGLAFAGPRPAFFVCRQMPVWQARRLPGQSTASVAGKDKTRMENIDKSGEPGRMSMAFTNKNPPGG